MGSQQRATKKMCTKGRLFLLWVEIALVPSTTFGTCCIVQSTNLGTPNIEYITMHLSLAHSLAVLATLLSYSCFVEAIPRGPGGPYHAPGCPYNSVLQGRNRVFLRFWHDPSNLIESAGGYRASTENHFFDDFTITDNTPNYPSPVKGVSFPPPGNYARSRLQFADIHSWIIPKARKVFGNVEQAPDSPFGMGQDPNDCLKFSREMRLLGTLLRPYG